MSLIQDALRRQMEEQEKKTATPSTQPEHPSSSESIVSTAMKIKPISDDTHQPEHSSSSEDQQQSSQMKVLETAEKKASAQKSKRRKILMAASIIVILLGGGFYYVWLPTLFEEPKPKQKQLPSAKVDAQSAPVARAAPAAIAQPQPSKNDTTAEPTQKKIAIPKEKKAPEVEAVASQKIEKPSEKQVEPTSKQPPSVQTPAPPPPPAAPLVWPDLKLTGILKGIATRQGAARINGKMIFIGDDIEGVTLIEIKDNGVILRYGNETKFLKVGGILY
jgi:hypothetical protein